MHDNAALIWVLKTELDKKDKSGIYGYTQRTLAFNSNRIEGSTLTEEQTASLFEEGYLPASQNFYRSKDVEEMNGHFLMFNKMLSTLGNPISEELIKEFHYELKAGVFEDRANGYAIGDYKKRANTVGGLTLSSPDDVADKMKELIDWYNCLKDITLNNLAAFHAKYELIHPFQDGNGRTGRLILFRECLEKSIAPFIIKNEHRIEYINALKNAQLNNDFSDLTSIFALSQKEYMDACEMFSVSDRYTEFLNFQNREMTEKKAYRHK